MIISKNFASHFSKNSDIKFGAKYQIDFPETIQNKVEKGFQKVDTKNDGVIILDLKNNEVPHDENNPEATELIRRRVTVTPSGPSDNPFQSLTFETSQHTNQKNWCQHLVYGALRRLNNEMALPEDLLKLVRKTMMGLKVEEKPDHTYKIENYHIPLPAFLEGKDINLTDASTGFITPLNHAIKDHQNDAVAMLLAHSEINPGKANTGTDKNNPENRGLNAVTTAIKYDNIPALKMVLDHPKTTFNVTPLMSVVEQRNHEAAEILVNHPKVDINKPIGTTTPLYKAVQKTQDPEMVKILAKNPKIDPNILFKNMKKVDKEDVLINSWPALAVAAKEGSAELVEALLSIPNIDVNATTVHNENEQFHHKTSLHYAIERGHDDVVELLLNDPRIKTDIESATGKTAVDLIFETGNVNYFRMYTNTLTDTDLNQPNEANVTLFNRALRENQQEFVEHLVENRGIDLTTANERGITPLHLAAIHGHLQLTEYILEEDHVDPFAKDQSNWTPFHWAVFKEQMPIVQLYINRFNPQIESMTATDQELIQLHEERNELK